MTTRTEKEDLFLTAKGFTRANQLNRSKQGKTLTLELERQILEDLATGPSTDEELLHSYSHEFNSKNPTQWDSPTVRRVVRNLFEADYIDTKEIE